jgi:2,5-furandicarboxylate decarboxylase 1
LSLREFIAKMEKRKEILHIKEAVSTRFEVSYLMKNFDNDGPVLMFENVKNSATKVVANVSGTRRRMSEALEVEPEKIYERLIESWRSPKKARKVNDAPAKECRERVIDLTKIPVLTHFEKDAGPYITSAVVHAKSPDGKTENVSVHRLQVLDKKNLAIRLVPRHLYKLWRDAKESGKDLDVAISAGVHPAVLLAASSPLPLGLNEYDVANTLLNNRLKLTECEQVDADAPADAELVLEGRISSTKEVEEGPFVDITGTYDIQRKQPVIEIVGVMHRENYTYQALLSSGAEHMLLMGLPHEVLIWEAVRKVVPKVCAVNLSKGGSGWLHAIISVDKQLDGDGKNCILAAFAAHPSLKHAIVVDSDIDVFNVSDVEWAMATRFQGYKDLVIVNNARGSSLDPSADQEKILTSKVGFDATRPFSKPKEKFVRAKIPANKDLEKMLRNLRPK